MKLTRRAMIKDGLLVVSAGMIMPAIFSRGVSSAQAQALDGSRLAQTASDRTLIVVQMAGGNDGLNTVVPFTDPLYQKLRPTLGLSDTKVLPLDTRLGLHPNLAPLKKLWDAGHLAVVEGVGYPNQSLSHFQAMDIWQTLDLNGNGSQGWLGKLVSGLVDQEGHPFKAMDIGVQTAQALQSISTQVPTISSVKNYRIYPDPADTDGGNARLQALVEAVQLVSWNRSLCCLTGYNGAQRSGWITPVTPDGCNISSCCYISNGAVCGWPQSSG